MATKKNILILIMALWALTSCVYAQNKIYDNISMSDIKVPGIIITGTYSQMIESLGIPISKYPSIINPVKSRYLGKDSVEMHRDEINCEYLVYDAYEYVRIGDSVQLVFIDLRKLRTTMKIKDLYINEKTTQKVFVNEAKRRGWWSDEYIECKVGQMDYHYCTYERVKNYLIDFKEDPYSSLTFTFYNRVFDKKIWWVEIPVMKIGGILH